MKSFVSFLVAFFAAALVWAQDYTVGTKVEILWSGSWYKGSIKEVRENQYKITYDGWSSSWDEWVGKDRLRLPGSQAAAKPKPAASSELPVTKKESTPLVQGATPLPGKWEATVTNGYKGDKITFTVAPDGKRITDVAFKGYWKNGSMSSIAYVEHLDPPNPFVITKGAFSAVQQVEKARMWWEFTGVFQSGTTAEGTYRAAFAGGQNDTYKLKWSAKRVSK